MQIFDGFCQMEQKFLWSQHDQNSRMMCIFKLLLALIYDRRNVIFEKKNSTILLREGFWREIDLVIWLTYELLREKFICHFSEKKQYSFPFRDPFIYIYD